MKNKLLLLLLLFTMIVIQTHAQTPIGAGIAVNTTFSIPAGQAPVFLNDATDYKFAVVSSDGASLIASQIFNYNTAIGNTINIAPTVLSNNTTYKWGVWSTLLDPTAGPPNGIGYYTFTTRYAVPTTQASNIIFPVVGTNSVQINWTVGNGSRRVVFMTQANTGTVDPTDGFKYTPNTLLGYGSAISSWSCVYDGTGGTPITVTNLAAGYTYRVMVFEYNGDPGTQATIVYDHDNTASNNPKNQLTLYAAPTLQASNITFPVVGTNSVTINWLNGNGTHRVVFMTQANTGTVDPTDGFKYTPNTLLGYGSAISSWSCVYDGTGATVNVTNIAAGYPYQVMVFEYNGDPGTAATIVYDHDNTASGNPNNVITLTAAPALSAPINGYSGISVLPTFTWGAVTGAASYKIYFSDNAGFASGVGQWTFSLNVGGVITYNTFSNLLSDLLYSNGFPLTNGTTYYWKVAGVNASGEGTASAPSHFTTTSATTVNLSTPSDGSTVYSSPATFGWYMGIPTSGLQFIVQYKYAASQPTDETFWSGTGFTSLTATASLNKTGAVLLGKTYYWRVLVQRTAAPNDYVYYPAYNVYNTFTTAGGSSVTVYPSWPIGGATVYTNSPTLNWYLDQYATGLTYNVNYVRANTAGDYNSASGVSGVVLTAGTYTPTLVNTASSNLYYTTPTLLPGTTYYWQVQASYTVGGTTSNWSSIESFVTNGTGTLQVPIPSYPTGGITVYTTAPILYWYLNSAATGLYYEIYYATSSGGEDGTLKIQTTTVDQLYKQMPSLTPGQTYYYKIRSKNVTTFPATVAGTYSNWSSEESFVVAGGTTLSYAVATWPIGNPTVYTNRPTLYWYLEGSSIGISGYTVKYIKGAAPADWTAVINSGSTDANGGTYSIPSSSTLSKLITFDLTYGASYTWAVYATGTTNPINPLGVGTFTIVGGSNNASVVLSQPEDGGTAYSTSVNFSWYINGSTAGLQSYTLRYSQSDQHTPYNDLSAGTHQYLNVSGLTSGATYYWTVRAIYTDGTIEASPWYSFTVNTGSLSIVQPLVGGPNNVTVNTTSPMLSWVLPEKAAANSTYEVQLADNPNFTSAQTFSSNKSYLSVNGLNSGKGYFWKVRSKDGTGNTSYYSGTGQFVVNNTVTAVEDKKIIPTQFELSQNYPNPFNPTTVINYSLPNNAFVVLKIYDMLGREIRTLVNNEMNAGKYSVTWKGDDRNGNKVTSGIYIYKISAGNYSAARKMIVLK